MSQPTTEEFFGRIEGFASFGQADQVKLMGWHLLTHRGVDRFSRSLIQECYDKLHLARPNISLILKRLVEKKPAEVLKDSRGFRLEARVKALFETRHGRRTNAVAIDALLADLLEKVAKGFEHDYLDEAMKCFRHGAFRTSVVMAWNVSFAHLLQWIVNDSVKLASFNAAITKKYPKRAGKVMATYDEFIDEFKEFEVIEVCGTAGLLTGNTKKILHEKLVKRNMAAHPSNIHFTQLQAEEFISDLVGNVVLKLV